MGPFRMFLCQLRRLPGPSLAAAEAFGPKECRDEGVHLLLKTSHDHAVSLMGPIGES